MDSLVRGALVALLIGAGVGGAACAKGGDADLGDDGEVDAGIDPRDDAAALPPRDSGVSPADAAPEDAAVDAGDKCVDALSKVHFDFEASDAGWTTGFSDGVVVPPDPSWPYNPWLRGTTSTGTTCKSGKCFGSELTKNYAQCHRGYLMSPSLDLSACKGRSVALVFEHAYAFFTGSYNAQTWSDGGVVEVSGDGTTWAIPTGTYPGTVKINPDRTASYACTKANAFGVHNKMGFTGAQTTTVKAELVLPAAAVTATTRIRFSTAAGVSSQTTNPDTSRSGTGFGWRIDDVAFVAK